MCFLNKVLGGTPYCICPVWHRLDEMALTEEKACVSETKGVLLTSSELQRVHGTFIGFNACPGKDQVCRGCRNRNLLSRRKWLQQISVLKVIRQPKDLNTASAPQCHQFKKQNHPATLQKDVLLF